MWSRFARHLSTLTEHRAEETCQNRQQGNLTVSVTMLTSGRWLAGHSENIMHREEIMCSEEILHPFTRIRALLLPSPHARGIASKIHKLILGGLLVPGFLMIAAELPSLSQDRPEPEIIQATARGTSTQLGQIFQVKLFLNEYSNDEDRQILIEAFQKGGNEGLVNALEKMRAVGRIAIEGTLGYDLSFIRVIPTPTGRKIRFITNRLLRFGETYYSTRTADYNLTAGEIDLNDKDKSKSTGVLYPAAMLRLDKKNELTLDLNQNPWQIINIRLGR